MAEFGFISDKLEIKCLILYIASRLVGPAPFEMIQELGMCDDGVDYFAFSECMADMVRTQHLVLDGDGLYSITEKGRSNAAATESSLPFTVRMQVEKDLVSCNEQLKRRSLVGASIAPRKEGGCVLTLSLSDDRDPLMKLELLVTREDMAKDMQKNFRAHAEEIYGKILSALYGG